MNQLDVGPLITLVSLAIVVAMIVLARHSFEKTLTTNALPLNPDEHRVGELYIVERGVLSNDDGKLVLTNKRLIRCKFNEKSVQLSVTPKDIVAIKIGHKTGRLIKHESCEISYVGKHGTATAVWNILDEKVVAGNPLVFMKERRYPNPHSAESFGALLKEWIDVPSKVHVSG